jgi:hypothetical protein
MSYGFYGAIPSIFIGVIKKNNNAFTGSVKALYGTKVRELSSMTDGLSGIFF